MMKQLVEATPNGPKQPNDRYESYIMKKILVDDESIDYYEINQRVASNIVAEHEKNADCASNSYFKNKIARPFVENPLIANGNRVHMRSFMLVASSNPLIIYYKKGFFTSYPFLSQEQVMIKCIKEVFFL